MSVLAAANVVADWALGVIAALPDGFVTYRTGGNDPSLPYARFVAVDLTKEQSTRAVEAQRFVLSVELAGTWAQVDAGVTAVSDALKTDRTLGGLVQWALLSATGVRPSFIDGEPDAVAATVFVQVAALD